MTTTQERIIEELGVTREFDAAIEAERRIRFLANYLTTAKLQGYVLGISGGVDSTVAGRLTQLAVERLRDQGLKATFHAVRLPYGKQKDEQDAQAALSFIAADKVSNVNIQDSVDALHTALDATQFQDAEHLDFIKGNTKARLRMVTQYAIAGATSSLVVGTDHAAEALMGFFTKFGDGAADIMPLSGLNKRRVRSLGEHLGAPCQLIQKEPTADLESLAPLKKDEDAFGMTYEVIDDFLENKQIQVDTHEKILHIYQSTTHKRCLPLSPLDVKRPNAYDA